ncbi:AbrB family transcriptional regulator [Sphingomonas nostoxanthinifaciens]|uniref:AbrB family transcriptional regulator n=1 Tax=Sphingomonas nostoxanthinifaciens TaxID=2872652 RepID=UPI001CC1C93D|nr:AbrB family transcriptional regulator [Sphingomonas nostoxanthinifaciens]UAK23879.1 AbrB family transcriptional regulator [Sphingomonas nostoxanthinifaciens]
MARIALLLLASCAFAGLLEWVGLPAGLLLGPMAAAMIFSAQGGRLAVPPPLATAAQAVVGLLIARSFTPQLIAVAAKEPWILLGGTLTTLVAAAAIGALLARWKVLPGSVAVWGSMPGAATAMVLMARDEGAQWQLVAVMSYLRVIFVAAVASVLAATIAGHGGSRAPGGAWFPPVDPLGLAEAALFGSAGVWGGRKVGMPAAALLGPALFAAVAQGIGIARPQLPGWLLATSYLLVGWRIGLGFTPDIVRAARRAAARLVLAIAALIAFCAGCGFALAKLSGRDLLSCYLAMSPGGADSVAIIASSSRVDVPFVMSMQVARLVAVLPVGPWLARTIARRVGSDDAAAASSP